VRPLHGWTSHRFPVPLPDGHRFPVGKHAPLLEQLLAEEVLEARHVHPSEPAPLAWLTLVHDADFIARVTDGALDDAAVRRIGLPWSPELVLRARAAAAGTVLAAFAALHHGVAGNLAGGSHHAFRDRAAAYCLFNDAALAIAVLRAHGAGALRPFVADLDVHQGDGTAAMCAEDGSIFTFSLHAASNYPHVKQRSTLDVELPDGTGDDDYLGALDRHLPAALDAHAPDLVIYQAGVDPLAEDRLGHLALTHAGLAARDARVFAWCEARGVPVVFTMGGGYAEPLAASVAAHAAVWRAARHARDRRSAVHDGRPFDHDVDVPPVAR
jgi:acetoin utilization deacetylase AcuC-like enzyme